MNGEPEQEHLFNPERFSPLHLSVWMHVPRGFGRTLAIASCVGRSIRRDSTFMPLRHGKDVIGVYLGPKQIQTTVTLADVSSRYWRRFMEECENFNIGHRCGPGALTIFIDWLQSPCPNPACGTELLINAEPQVPPKRNLKYRGTELQVPRNVPRNGDAYGMNRGMEDLEVSNSSGLEANEGQGDDVGSVLEPARVSKKRVEAPVEPVSPSVEATTTWCLRCQRYGTDHIGDHAREWTTMRRGAW